MDKVLRRLKIFSIIFFMFSIGFCIKKIDIFLTTIERSYMAQDASLFKERENTFGGMVLATNNFFIQSMETGQVNFKNFFDILTEPAVIHNFGIDYDVQPVVQVPDSVRIPVFVYHHIGPNPQSSGDKINNVTTQMFKDQMEYLKKKEYKVLSMQEFYNLLEKGINPDQKSVLITVDDGYHDFYDNAFPILKEYKYKATIFVPYNKKEFSDSELLEMSNYGIDVQSHTMTHTSLSMQRSNQNLNFELNDSKQKITEVTNRDTFAFAYPYCIYNQPNLNYVKNSQYRLAFKCGNIKGNSIDHTFANRFEIYRNWAYNNMQNFIDRLSGIQYRPVDLGLGENLTTKFKML